jgi:hypothetical protein
MFMSKFTAKLMFRLSAGTCLLALASLLMSGRSFTVVEREGFGKEIDFYAQEIPVSELKNKGARFFVFQNTLEQGGFLKARKRYDLTSYAYDGNNKLIGTAPTRLTRVAKKNRHFAEVPSRLEFNASIYFLDMKTLDTILAKHNTASRFIFLPRQSRANPNHIYYIAYPDDVTITRDIPEDVSSLLTGRSARGLQTLTRGVDYELMNPSPPKKPSPY